jgi:replicative DNA helicase
MSSFLKKVPSDERAERNLLGACLIGPDIYPSLVTRIKGDDFYNLKNAQIWSVMTEVFNEGKEVNLVTLSTKATQEDSRAYLYKIMQECPSTMYTDEWVSTLKNYSKRRSIIMAAGRIVAAAYEESDASVAEERARTLLDEAVGEDDKEALLSPKRQADLLRSYLESKQDANSALVATGYPTLDMYCGGGFRRGDLIIVAARTSVGKSTFAENIAENVALTGKRVLFVSVEMTPEQMLYRYAVRQGKLSTSTLEYGINSAEEDDRVTALQQERMELPFYIFDAPGATVSAIRAQMSRMASTGQLSLVVVDYLQLLNDITDKDGKEHLRIGQITKNLKHLAREYDTPIILISQLNRNLEYRGGEPKLADLRESGRIEEDADLVLMLWEIEQADAMGNVTRAKIAKNRQGPQEKLPIRFNKPSFKFVEPIGSGTIEAEGVQAIGYSD